LISIYRPTINLIGGGMKYFVTGIFYVDNDTEYKKELGIKRSTIDIKGKSGAEMSMPLIENITRPTLITRIKLSLSFTLLKDNKEDAINWTISGFRIVFVPCDVDIGSVKNSFGINSKPYNDIQRLLYSETFTIKENDPSIRHEVVMEDELNMNIGDRISMIVFAHDYNKKLIIPYNLHYSTKE